MYLKIFNIDINRKQKMYLNQLNYWRVTVTPFVLIRLSMPPTLWSIATLTQMFRACIYSRNLSLGRFKTQPKFRNNLFWVTQTSIFKRYVLPWKRLTRLPALLANNVLLKKYNFFLFTNAIA
jgi:hypothetical protein